MLAVTGCHWLWQFGSVSPLSVHTAIRGAVHSKHARWRQRTGYRGVRTTPAAWSGLAAQWATCRSDRCPTVGCAKKSSPSVQSQRVVVRWVCSSHSEGGTYSFVNLVSEPIADGIVPVRSRSLKSLRGATERARIGPVRGSWAVACGQQKSQKQPPAGYSQRGAGVRGRHARQVGGVLIERAGIRVRVRVRERGVSGHGHAGEEQHAHQYGARGEQAARGRGRTPALDPSRRASAEGQPCHPACAFPKE